MLVAMVSVAVAMTMMRMAVAMSMTGGLGCVWGGCRPAIELVIPVSVVVRVRGHSRYNLFYARCGSR